MWANLAAHITTQLLCYFLVIFSQFLSSVTRRACCAWDEEAARDASKFLDWVAFWSYYDKSSLATANDVSSQG